MISIRDLYKRYGSSTNNALNGVELDIGVGEVFGTAFFRSGSFFAGLGGKRRGK